MKNDKIIGVYTLNNFGGLVVLDISDEKITTGFSFGDGVKNIYTSPIKYNDNGEPFLTRYGADYFLSDIMRV